MHAVTVDSPFNTYDSLSDKELIAKWQTLKIQHMLRTKDRAILEGSMELCEDILEERGINVSSL